jgi:uncharacterized repeat protein (TIGR01451 family)
MTSHSPFQRWLTFFAIFALLSSAIFPTRLTAQAQDAPAGGTRLERVPTPTGADGVEPQGSDLRPLSENNGLVRVVLELEAEPAVQTYAAALGVEGATGGESPEQLAAATAAAQSQLAVIESAQQALLAPLAKLEATVLYRTQRVFNGVAVSVEAAHLGDLQGLPGVKAVHPLVIKHLDNAYSVPIIGAPELWSTLPITATGRNMKIGVIDTGIDYLHTNFGGPGLYTGQVFTDSVVPWNAKVVGGYDFAGDDYNADPNSSSYQPIPRPDPDPMDCNGHGSHVAGTAAGYGVTSTGATYTGTYGVSTPFTSLRIGPGAAPEAQLYALRVFGCDGSTDITDLAIEWAVDPNKDGDFSDRLDVINMSLGSNTGSIFDTTAVAADNAVLAGVIVVASAGNAGDVYYITGSPGTSGRTISVAGSEDSASVLGGFVVSAPVGIAGQYPASEAAFGPDLATTGPLTDTLTYAVPANGCTALTNGAAITGTIALIDRGGCTFKLKVRNAQLAGAVGVLIANNVAGDPFTMGDDAAVPNPITIPSMMTTLAVGNLIKPQLVTGVTATLTSAFRESVINIENDRVDTVYTSSSRGPRRGDTALKPDITAPAVTIYSTETLSGNSGDSFNGTSMAAPHVAGTLALLKQLHPTWTVEQLKALVMNTALNDIRTSNPITSTLHSLDRIAAGRVDVPLAASNSVMAFNADNPGLVSVSFGSPQVVDSASAVKNIRVLNKGTSAASYNLELLTLVDNPGVTFALTGGSTVNVPAGGSLSVPVLMSADAATMTYNRDPSIATSSNGITRHWLATEQAYLQLIPTNAQFAATLSGANEVPPVTSDAVGTATFTYDSATNQLTYDVTVTATTPITITAAHIHQGLPKVNGGVIPNGTLYGGSPVALNPGDTWNTSGTVTLTAGSVGANYERLLMGGDLYVNVHTEGNPSGEVRGQIRWASAPALRVPLYAAPRPASAMQATTTSLDFGAALTATTAISLTGTGVNIAGTPAQGGVTSLVTGLELGVVDPNEASSSGIVDNADIQYVGLGSDFAASDLVTNTTLFFGVTSHGGWSTPREVEFDVYIDTNRDGVTDYVLFNWNFGAASGLATDDVFVSVLRRAGTPTNLAVNFLNSVSAGTANTYAFNNNVMVLPIDAVDLGLTQANSRFNYYVVSFSRDTDGQADITPVQTYDPAKPGLDASGGFPGMPVYTDNASSAIPVDYNAANYGANGSLGLMLLHHHNATNRAEVITVQTAQANLAVDGVTAPAGGYVVPGQPITLTLTATNLGPQTATGVVLTNTLPATGLTFGSFGTNRGTCTGTLTLVCNLGTMLDADTATITMTVTPSGTAAFSSTVTVSSPVIDLALANNTRVITVPALPLKVYLPVVSK